MPSPRYWREVPARLRLEASRCASCGFVAYPPRMICPKCRKTEFATTTLTPEGKVVTATVIHVSPTDLQMEAPYAMAIVETPEKARLMVQMADTEPGDVRPGMDVRLEFRRIRKEGKSGILCYGYKAVPAG